MDEINKRVYRGEVWIANLGDGMAGEQQGERPVLIVQNNAGNKHSITTIVAAITSKVKRTDLPVHVPISEKFLFKDSEVLLETIRQINTSRLTIKVGKISQENQKKIDEAIMFSVGVKRWDKSVDNGSEV